MVTRSALPTPLFVQLPRPNAMGQRAIKVASYVSPKENAELLSIAKGQRCGVFTRCK